LIFTGWFHAAQALQTLSMILYVGLIGCGLSMLFGVVDKRKSKSVIISVVLMVFICWVLITQLGVVGINIDLEKKQAEIRGMDTWLTETKSSALSWSYGLAAFALLFVLIALNILVWCVYPRKVPGGRLLEQAWHWPANNDLPCCLAGSTHNRWMDAQELSKFNKQDSHIHQQQTYSPFSPTPMELITCQPNNVGASEVTDITSFDVATYNPRSSDSFSNEARGFSAPPAEAKDNLIESLMEKQHTEGRHSSQSQDPRTTADLKFSRVSSRMSSIRSSTNEVDTQALLYFIDKNCIEILMCIRFQSH
uniref:MARVEL domain-containing protein n=1 Tax=Rodentolepis nana TaxID=102285 RepID=A0A158QIU9_RODNA